MSKEDIFDPEVPLAVMERDFELLREIACEFIADCPRKIRDIEQAFLTEDRQALHTAVHTLKGSLSHFGKKRAYSVIEKLNRSTQTAPLKEISVDLAQLKEELSLFVQALQKDVIDRPVAESS